MANSIVSSGTFSVRLASTVTKFDGDLSLNKTLTGSNATSDAKTISGSGFTPLATSSLSNLAYGYFWNAGTYSNITIWRDGTAWFHLRPDGHTQFEWSASAVPQLSASLTSGSIDSDLVYILAES